jgi:transcriptional regulator with XRE-family HTH domain
LFIIDNSCCQSISDNFFILPAGDLMISPAQCRAARALLDWSQQELADKAGVGVVTVRNFEGGSRAPHNSTMDVIKRCLESAGVEFIDANGGGAGVRFRRRPRATERK